ncbi:MAG: DNRLRE domain-containing protein [Akkermansiaceae bacterium]|nr:DNRLRE domain-containing protein [Akkermansiaceae bacterium]
MRSFQKYLYTALAAAVATGGAHAFSDPPVTINFQNGLDDYWGGFERRISTGTMRTPGALESAPVGSREIDGMESTGQAEFYVDGGANAFNDRGFAHILIRFDDLVGAGRIPAGAKITSAKLHVIQKTHGNAQSGDVFTVFRLARPFDSNSSSNVLENPEADFGADGIFGDVDWILGSFRPPNTATTAATVTADITRAVQSWVDGAPNNGIGIAPEQGTNAWSFHSSGSTQNLRPRLEVTYVTGTDVQAKDFQPGLNGYAGLEDMTLRTGGASILGKNAGTLGFDYPEPGTTQPDIPGLMRFSGPEVEALLNDRRVEKATFRLYTANVSNAQSPGPFTVHRLLVPFSETTVRGDFAPDTGGMIAAGQITPPIGTFTDLPQFRVVDMDVTAAVKAWGYGAPNHGLYIAAGTSDAWSVYSSTASQGTGANLIQRPGRQPSLSIVTSPRRPVEVTFPESDTRHTIGTPVTFQATATPIAPATITRVDFVVDGAVVGTDANAPYTFTYPADKLGNFVLIARMVGSDGVEVGSDNVNFSVVPPSGSGGLYFDGMADHVALGDPAELKLSTFTVETWFKRETKGITTTTGGVTGIPLVAKGRNQAENSTLDTNWFLGIREADGVLLGDYEALSGGANVPITGVTPVPYGQWNHAAMTFDGANFRLYLNGKLERIIATTVQPRADSIQHASIATAMDSNGLAEGFFGGYLDEVRIWNVARTSEQIRAKLNAEVTTETGLVARWGMTEGTGTTLTSSVTPAVIGNFSGSPVWASGAVFSNNELPTVVFTAPANGSTYATGQSVDVTVSAVDPDGTVAKVEFHDNGALAHTATAPPFTWPYTVLSGNRRLTAVITDNLGGVTTTDAGLLLAGTLTAPTIQGLSAGIIDGGDEEIFLGGTPKNPATWEVVSSTDAPLSFTNPGTTLGEIAVQVNGTGVPFNSGVLLTTNVVLDGNTASLDNLVPPYVSGGNYRVASWDNNGPGELEPLTTPESSSFAMGFFPYNKGWIGTTIAADGTVGAGAGALPAGVTVTNGAVGSYIIAGLPTDGNVIAVAAGQNSDDVATVRRSGSDFWEVLIRDNNQNAENASFTFLFIPSTSGSVLSGQIQNEAQVAGLNREAAMVGVNTRQTVQGYEITFGDGSVINPSNTALFITGDGGAGNGADNIYSYIANGNSFTVFSHDLPGLNGVFQAGGFRFLAVPLNPRVAGNDEVAVSVTKAFATEGVEGDNKLTFTVGRSGSTTAALNVNYTLGGTADAGTDYTTPAGVVTIPAGATSAVITIDVLEDQLLEADETVTVTLAAGGGYSLSPYVTSMGTIRNAASNLESTTLTFQQGLNDYTGTFQRRIVRGATIDSASNGDSNPNPNPELPDLVVQNYSMDGGVPDANDMLRFDNLIGSGPGQIPAGARILKAELSMLTVVAADAQSGGPYVVGRLTEAVSRDTTYSMVHGGAGDVVSGIRGIVDRENLSAGFGQVAQGEWGVADVTDILRGWVERGLPNHGFGLFSGGTSDAWNYCTIGNTTVANRPKLVVTYTTVATEEYNLVADRSALFNSRPGSSTFDGAELPDQGFLKTAPNDTQEAMLRFPVDFADGTVGSIPLDREIVKAELMVRTGGNFDSWTTGSASIHQVITPWTPATSYGVNGAQVGVNVAASSVAAKGMGNRSHSWVDVTHIVRNWRAGAANEGFNLKLSNAQNWGFHFPGDQNSAFVPILRITTDRGANIPVETPFEEWARLSDSAGILMTDDTDGDGILALVEYALGFSPKAHDTLPGVIRNGDTVSISFPKGTLAAGDGKISYEILGSTDLVDWTVETAATQTSTAITLSITESETKKFYRLRVVHTP